MPLVGPFVLASLQLYPALNWPFTARAGVLTDVINGFEPLNEKKARDNEWSVVWVH